VKINPPRVRSLGALLALCSIAPLVPAQNTIKDSPRRGALMKRFLISDFGTVADATTLNTAAIQKAVDAAAAHAGGGIVRVPAGTFLSGSIFLKRGVELSLDEGAVLLGSTNLADYPKRETRIEGVALQDSGFWNLHLYRCRDVTIEGIRITIPSSAKLNIRGPSTDGIDVDSCQHVTIRRCYISTNDDNIALKGSKGPRADQDADSPPVENILVEDCEVGDGNGLIDITLRNIRGEYGAFGTLRGNPGDVLRDITLENIDVKFTGPQANSERLALGVMQNTVVKNVRVNGQPFVLPAPAAAP
jgi:polygalacturonase